MALIATIASFVVTWLIKELFNTIQPNNGIIPENVSVVFFLVFSIYMTADLPALVEGKEKNLNRKNFRNNKLLTIKVVLELVVSRILMIGSAIWMICGYIRLAGTFFLLGYLGNLISLLIYLRLKPSQTWGNLGMYLFNKF